MTSQATMRGEEAADEEQQRHQLGLSMSAMCKRLTSPDNSRSALVYLCAGTTSTYRIRVERYPEIPGWVGGRVLRYYDQSTPEAALAIARTWTGKGELPPEHATGPYCTCTERPLGSGVHIHCAVGGRMHIHAFILGAGNT